MNFIKQGHRKNENIKKNTVKVVIITMGLSNVVRYISENYNIAGIVECAPRKSSIKTNKIHNILKKVYYIVAGKNTLRNYAKAYNIPYYYMNKGSDLNLEKWISYILPDIIIVYSMSQLLKRNIFTIPKYGTINLHPAILPDYRGPNPIFWTYYNYDKKSGVTIHYIDDGEDTGDIIYQESYNITPGMRVTELLENINNLGIKLLSKALDNIENLPRITQPQNSPTLRASNIRPQQHQHIIDWNNWEIDKIWHILRGTEYWLNAFEQPSGLYKGHRWKIENFDRMEMKGYNISQVYNENNQNFLACKDGKIYLSVTFSFKKFIINLI